MPTWMGWALGLPVAAEGLIPVVGGLPVVAVGGEVVGGENANGGELVGREVVGGENANGGEPVGGEVTGGEVVKEEPELVGPPADAMTEMMTTPADAEMMEEPQEETKNCVERKRASAVLVVTRFCTRVYSRGFIGVICEYMERRSVRTYKNLPYSRWCSTT